MRQLCMARSDLLWNVCNVSICFFLFFYEDIYKDKHLFDLSNYPCNDKQFDSTNKKVPGVFKDETSKVPIKSFVGLEVKCIHLLKKNK